MHHTYILISETGKTYTGSTELPPSQRLAQHNNGENHFTAQHRPWALAGFIAVDSKPKAQALERYLKTGAGRAFLSKYILN